MSKVKSLFTTVLTGCEKLRAVNNALSKHMVPVKREGSPSSSTELTQRRLDNGNKIKMNTSGVSTRGSFRKSFIENDVLHEYTSEVHKTTVKNNKIIESNQVSDKGSFMKFNIRKNGHFEGFEEE